jgi:hypothetical protein
MDRSASSLMSSNFLPKSSVTAILILLFVGFIYAFSFGSG